MADITAKLRGLAAFADMDAGQVASIAASMEPFRVKSGEVLFRQNDPADGMHVIAQGRIGVQGRTLADGVVDLAEVGAGDVVGEFALIDQGGRRSATARAVEPVRGWFLPREQFERLCFVGDPAAARLGRHIRLLAANRTRATLTALADAPTLPGEVRPAGSGRAKATTRTPDEMAALVGALHQFRHFKAAEVVELLAAAKVLEAPRGAVLAATGAVADGLRIVVRGALRLGLPRPGGVEQLLVHGPGKIAGAGPAVDGEAHAAQLDVREDALVVHVPQAQVVGWRGEAGGMAGKLADLTAKQLTADLRALSRHQGRRRSMAALNEG